jgi:O-antigen ligase
VTPVDAERSELHPGDGVPSTRIIGERAASFALAFAVGIIATGSAFSNALRATHLGAIAVLLLGAHAMMRPRIFWCRELSLYAAFLSYMLLALLWTRDMPLSANTLVPAASCLLVAVLAGSLVRFHDQTAALGGLVYGFIAAALGYTMTTRFPLHYPKGFSYNAIAAMYAFGLFLVILYGQYRRHITVWLAVASVVFLLVVATTSIKTNLGIALGGCAAALMYHRTFRRALKRRVGVLLLFGGAIAMLFVWNQRARDALDRGVQRIELGVEVLEARENLPGYSAFNEREFWERAGLEGWELNPIFGYGPEAFRADYGITSHSTPIDLLYNTGLIGISLFYGMFGSLTWRLIRDDRRVPGAPRAVMLAALVCYAFISLSGTMEYNVYLLATIGVSAALLQRFEHSEDVLSSHEH